jgi:hypothetical protein
MESKEPQNTPTNDGQSNDQPQSAPSRFAGISNADPAERIRKLKQIIDMLAKRIIEAAKHLDEGKTDKEV